MDLGCESSPIRLQRFNSHLILLPRKGTLVVATCFSCPLTWDKGMKRIRRYKSHKSERPGYWARSFSSFPHQKKAEFTVGIENELQPQLSVHLLGSDPESKITKDPVLLTANGQSQVPFSLDNFSKFQSKTMQSARNYAVKESCPFTPTFASASWITLPCSHFGLSNFSFSSYLMNYFTVKWGKIQAPKLI